MYTAENSWEDYTAWPDYENWEEYALQRIQRREVFWLRRAAYYFGVSRETRLDMEDTIAARLAQAAHFNELGRWAEKWLFGENR